MAVEQVYMFSVGTENIRGALATDGVKVQYLTPDAGIDDEDNLERAASAENMLKLAKGPEGDQEIEDPFVVIAGNVMALVTDPVEFPDFAAAAVAAQELFDRGAVADDFAIE